MNVSGGQKARISLARAVYSNADIMLLDDPLSAVDPSVADKIFTDCIRGALKDKVVILVTHQIQFLERCPKIMLIKENKVLRIGNMEAIMEAGFNVKDILDSFNKGGAGATVAKGLAKNLKRMLTNKDTASINNISAQLSELA